MAGIRRDSATKDECVGTLTHRRLPHQVRKRVGDSQQNRDTITVLTTKVSKGLEFQVVMVAGVGQMPAAGEDEKEEARVFYVAATQRLVIGVSGEGGFGRRLE